ncbi:GH11044 [Drosophila grimshawi]|uniref:Phospholipase B1, membrane-associated n=1 Tax=Drosophila grimshawi TaxID=7222 RepID=B4JC66_DROGR|nr:GH11044 [Drosophila grimshawi]
MIVIQLVLFTQQLLSLTAARLETPILNRSGQMLSRLGIQSVPFNLGDLRNGHMYYTNLEKYRNIVLVLRNASINIALAGMDQMMASNKAEGKLQQPVPEDQPFPCNLSQGRSPEPPSLISQLRPGDIDIVAAFGDSVTAGSGLLSRSFFDVSSEFRGLSFSGGGIGNWRTSLTLPNILKLYNPQLYGYATHGLVADRQRSVFNVAEPMLITRDLPYQALVLIERLQSDPKVNMQQHWKLLTINVGMNDICFELCSWDDSDEFLHLQRQQAYRALSMLRDNVPRLMINWVLLPDIHEFLRLLAQFPDKCNLQLICSCMTRLFRPQYLDVVQQLQRMPLELAALSEFRRDDFVIVTHDLLSNLTGIVIRHGAMDMRFFSHDCMHFSQRGHAIASSALWNSMQQKLDLHEVRAWRQPVQHMMCPSAERPFLRII